MKKNLSLLLLMMASVARADGGSESEIHLRLCPTSLSRLAEKLELGDAEREDYKVWFVESADLALNNVGMVFRIREFSDTSAKVTVKMQRRPEWEIDDDWFESDDFKCEIDTFTDRAKESCSMDSKTTRFPELHAGQLAFQDLLDRRQLKFLAGFAPVDSSRIAFNLLGPVPVKKWEDDEDEIDLEIWTFADKTFDAEISQKSETSRAPQTLAKLLRRVKDAGVPLCPKQNSKTRDALEKLLRR